VDLLFLPCLAFVAAIIIDELGLLKGRGQYPVDRQQSQGCFWRWAMRQAPIV